MVHFTTLSWAVNGGSLSVFGFAEFNVSNWGGSDLCESFVHNEHANIAYCIINSQNRNMYFLGECLVPCAVHMLLP